LPNKKIVTLEGHFQEIEDYNSTFKKVKIKVFAFDKNRNNSDITRTAFSKARDSIFNIPIIAKYNEEKDDLEGHNAYLTKDKNGNYIIKMDTSPIGVVSSEANISFEDIDEGNENIKTYIVVDNVFLWKRYEATQKIEEWLSQGIEPKVSMEIGNVEGQFSDGVFVINSFEFEAITALGSDVEPCFPMAQIEEYSKQTFQEAYFEMVKELQFSLNNQSSSPEVDDTDNNKNFKKEDEVVDEKLELLKKYNLTPEKLSFKIDEFSLEEIESKIKEQFSLSNSQLMTEINKILETMKEVRENYWGELKEVKSFYLMDLKDNNAIVVTYDWDTYFGIPYVVNGDIVTLDFEAKVEFIPDWRPKQTGDNTLFTNVKEIITSEFSKVKEDTTTKINEVTEKYTTIENEKTELQTKYDEISTEYEKVKPELTRLQEFETKTLTEQRQTDETELFSKFDEELNTDEQYKTLKSKASEFSLEELETKCFALLGKKKANFSLSRKDKSTIKIKVEHKDEIEQDTPYGDLHSKYLK
jgi:hypothetical protein